MHAFRLFLLFVGALAGIYVGALTAGSIMGLATHGFWRGVLGTILCVLMILVAGAICAAAIIPASDSFLFPLVGSFFNAFTVGGWTALGYSLGVEAVGFRWVGVVFAIVLASVMSFFLTVFVRGNMRI